MAQSAEHRPPEPEFVVDQRYGKSRSNRRTESSAVELLCSDRRFQVLPNRTKQLLLTALGVKGSFTARTFDAVYTPSPAPPITTETLRDHLADIKVIELKTTRKPIKNAALNGFFFGATKNEYDLAEALGDRHRFCFVVLNSENDYGRPFFVLLTLEELEKRTKTKRVQYQVNLRSDSEPGTLEPLFEGEVE